MRKSGGTLFMLIMLASLICAMQLEAAPATPTWTSELLYRAKRSLLWRWNTLKPIGAGCRDHYECGTNYCRGHICTFQPRTSSAQQ